MDLKAEMVSWEQVVEEFQTLKAQSETITFHLGRS